MKPRPNLFLDPPVRLRSPDQAGVPDVLWHVYQLALSRCDRPGRDRIRAITDILHRNTGMFAYVEQVAQVANLFAAIPRGRR